MPESFQVPPGLAVVTTYGSIQHETVQCLWDLRSHNDRQGVVNIQYLMVPGSLVDKARNDAVRTMLAGPAQWIWYVDGDMTFPPDTLLRLLQTAYAEAPQFDVVGGYCPLRGEMALPTIDTGTGTWESVMPMAGILPVIRTGGACLVVKRHVFERLPQPWFRMRVPMRAIDALAEVDNFARCKFDGRNPWRGSAEQWWEKLEQCAIDDPSITPGVWQPAEVGEDSGFMDRVKLAGMHICVNTDVVLGHVEKVVRTWEDHKKGMAKGQREQRLVCGVTT